jgi:peptidoglycan-N-acetylglucosamine deacetylase
MPTSPTSPTRNPNLVTPAPRHPVAFILLCATLFLSGCAAGTPTIAPVAPESSQEIVAEAPETAPAVAAAPESNTPPEAPSAEVVEQADIEAAVPEAVGQPASETDPATGSDSAAFAQTVPAVSEPLPDTTAVEDAPIENAPVDGVAAAPAVQTTSNRPPPPPDPGTGQSLIVESGSNGRLEVALTFDAGADTGYGAEILDLLRAEGIPATFGMTGLWAQANPDLVQRMAAEGHQLINHTWDHASLTGANTGMPAQTPEQIAQQLGDTETVVRDLTGYEMRPYFRPPYGDYDAASLGYLYDNGYYLSIWWTCDSHGWAGWGAQEIIDYCTTNIVEDEILLLHVGNAAATDFEALPSLIRFFRDSGYAFVTVEQMLQP